MRSALIRQLLLKRGKPPRPSGTPPQRGIGVGARPTVIGKFTAGGWVAGNSSGHSPPVEGWQAKPDGVVSPHAPDAVRTRCNLPHCCHSLAVAETGETTPPFGHPSIEGNWRRGTFNGHREIHRWWMGDRRQNKRFPSIGSADKHPGRKGWDGGDASKNSPPSEGWQAKPDGVVSPHALDALRAQHNSPSRSRTPIPASVIEQIREPP